jgi:hypothetical protein
MVEERKEKREKRREKREERREKREGSPLLPSLFSLLYPNDIPPFP